MADGDLKIFMIRRKEADAPKAKDDGELAYLVLEHTALKAIALAEQFAKRHTDDGGWVSRASCVELAEAVDLLAYSEPQIIGIKYHRNN